MKRILDVIGMSLGGWLGWEAGATLSLFVGYILAIFGTALGLVLTRRMVSRHLP